ncbi:chymotrypsin-2-like [Fopius arisanus]|uniref:Chymotrypsin-2-like n=1 Tax=Fopius arisanus TaxID=64838 RepID=A0A9R1T6H4_9HYME|nr:PREDICTED: chymotrypsin-2-like [Fopius arisanus]
MISRLRTIIIANVLITLFIGVSGRSPSRIVQGSYAEIGEFPYMVSLRWSDYGHMCGGSIIGRRHILTAGHCVDEFTPEELNVASGFINQNDRSAVVSKVEKIIMHPDFVRKGEGRRLQNDVAVLILKEDLELDGFLRDVVKLPVKPYVPETRGIVTGWGYTKSLLDQDADTDTSDDLFKLNLTIITHDECRKFRLPPFEYQICATNSHGVVCKGDSGGPLVVENVQVGVLSTSSCLIGSTPAFMDVYYFKDFIEKSMI